MKAVLVVITLILCNSSVHNNTASDTNSNIHFADQVFILVEGGSVNDPLDYQAFSGDMEASCPNDGCVCAIEVLNSDIFTSWEAPTPAHIGKPKVNQTPLSSLINNALSSGQDPYIQPGTNRIVWQHECSG